MIAFNTQYGVMRWSSYFALCFWRLRLKINRFCAYPIQITIGLCAFKKFKNKEVII